MENFIQVVLLGIIEGITEFLPISSTGHLLIAEQLGLGHRSELFNIGIQAGAILAVVFIYWSKLWSLLSQPFAPQNKMYLQRLAVAFGVTVIGALIAKKLGLKLPETLAPIAWALLVGGILILWIEVYTEKQNRSVAVVFNDDSNIDAPLSLKAAIAVGAAQVLAAIFPGTSRSAASIFSAMLAGSVSRVAATEFSFMVGIPTMFAATAKSLLDLRKTPQAFAAEDWSSLGLGFVVSAIVAFVVVKWLLRYIQTHNFKAFAWYRIVLGAALLVFVAVR